MKPVALAIHGGAGDLPFWGMNEEREQEYKAALDHCLMEGYAMLKKNRSALDAVEAALIALEDHPLFNAGRGSAINRAGEVEMDASIICGKTLRSGAVSVVKGVKNPIVLARHVMDYCEHLYLSGEGAMEFAKEMNLEFRPLPYFITTERLGKWKEQQEKGGTADTKQSGGTSGAIAIDVNGDLAAGTSTGGLVNKRRGRVGDTPIIGAGTYADNNSCAVSCTGTGEYIIRKVVAHEISALIRHRNISLHDACEYILEMEMKPLGGQFGMIAMDTSGTIKCVFNTERMYRAWIDAEGKKEILLY